MSYNHIPKSNRIMPGVKSKVRLTSKSATKVFKRIQLKMKRRRRTAPNLLSMTHHSLDGANISGANARHTRTCGARASVKKQDFGIPKRASVFPQKMPALSRVIPTTPGLTRSAHCDKIQHKAEGFIPNLVRPFTDLQHAQGL